MSKATEIGPEVTNGAANAIEVTRPYQIICRLRGDVDMLFHRYNIEDVAEKSAAAKGSATKKIDNLESYIWKDDDGHICIPGLYVVRSMIMAAKSQRDPRSPRKSAQDLFEASIMSDELLSPILIDNQKIKTWQYEHKAPVMIQQARVTRTRPAIKKGWEAEFILTNLQPEYISLPLFQQVLVDAGKFQGLADYRPTYGRFSVIQFKKL
jgi:hypothetical protein